MIKFYDLKKQDKVLEKKILLNISKVVKQKNFINGIEVEKFEKKFSYYTKANYSVACSNGTDALTLALKSLNLKKNSEVIIPAMTYVSTAYAVLNANLRPVLVDIDYNTGLMNLDILKKIISKQTKVIIPVHLYGNVINLVKLNKIKQKSLIVDDASQAHGAQYDNKRKVGTGSLISCFSLYPGKNLGAYGDAGIITTHDYKIKKDIIKLGNLGADRIKKYDHISIGNNNRLDTIQAAILNVKLKNLDANNTKRKRIAKFYLKKIKNKKVNLLNYSKYAVYHQFIVLVKNRKKFMDYMLSKKIQTAIHYPKSINQHSSIKKLFKNKKFPVAEKFAKECVSIPIDPYLNNNETATIVKAINDY